MPSFALGSAAAPASKSIETLTIGTALRRANATAMPFDSVACSIVGKFRSAVRTGTGMLPRPAVCGAGPVADAGALTGGCAAGVAATLAASSYASRLPGSSV